MGRNLASAVVAPFVGIGSQIAAKLAPVGAAISSLASTVGAKAATFFAPVVTAASGLAAKLPSAVQSGVSSMVSNFGGGLTSMVVSAAAAGTAIAGKLRDGIALAGTTVAAGLVGIAKVGIDAFSSLNTSVSQLQRVTGGTTAEVSGLRGAMQLSGMSVDDAATNVTRLATKLETAGESADSAGKLSKQLGFNILDAQGNVKDMTAILPQLADKFAGMQNGTEKTALAVQLFGRSGTTMLPFLNKGSAGIAELTGKADELGLVLDSASQAKFAAFREAMRGLTGLLQGFAVRVGATLIPGLTAGAQALTKVLTPAVKWARYAIEGLYDLVGKGDFTGAFALAFNVNADAPVVKFILKVRDGIKGLADSGSQLKSVLGPAAGVLGALSVGAIPALAAKLPIFGGAIAGMLGPLKLLGGPIGIIAAGLAGLALSGGDAGAMMSGLTGVISSIAAAIPGVVASITAQIPQLVQMGVQLIDGLIQGIVQNLPALVNAAVQLVDGLLQGIVAVLPALLQGGADLLMGLVQGLIQALPTLIDAAVQLVQGLLQGILTALPILLQAGLRVVMGLLTGIIQALPQIIQGAIQLVMALLQGIVQMLPQIITAAVELVMALVTGLVGMLPELIDAAIVLITALLAGIIDMLPQLIASGIQLVIALVAGLIKAIPQLVMALPQIIAAIVNAFATMDWGSIGRDLIRGIGEGIAGAGGQLLNMAKNAVGNMVDGVKSFFGIHSPSRLMRDQVGKFIPAGIGVGIEDGTSALEKQATDMARAAAARVQAVVDGARASLNIGVNGKAGGAEGSDGQPKGETTNNYYLQNPDIRGLLAELSEMQRMYS